MEKIKVKIIIAGSFAVYEEIKNLAKKLEVFLDVECVLPKFFKGYINSSQIEELKRRFKAGIIKLKNRDLQKIGEVEDWFFNQIEKADIVLIYNKKKEGGEMGINAAVDLGYSLGKGKKIIFLFDPLDGGVKALATLSNRNIEIVSPDRIVDHLVETKAICPKKK